MASRVLSNQLRIATRKDHAKYWREASNARLRTYCARLLPPPDDIVRVTALRLLISITLQAPDLGEDTASFCKRVV